MTTWPTPPNWIYTPRWYHLDSLKRRLTHPSFLVRVIFGTRAARRLSRHAVYWGYPIAAYQLAHFLDLGHKNEPAHAVAARAVRSLKSRKAINAVWQAWIENRNPELGQILLAHQQPIASEPPDVRTLCLLKLGHNRLLSKIPADQIPRIVTACSDSDTQIAKQARDTLLHLKNRDTIDRFCHIWQENPTPLLNELLVAGKFTPSLPEPRVYKALATNKLAAISEMGKDAVDPLIGALQDAAQEIAARAKYCLLNLQKMDAVNHFCARWYRTRDPDLENCLLRARYIAGSPPEVQLATIFKNNRMDLAEQISPEAVSGLVTAAEDADPAIREGASQAIQNLQNVEAQEALLEHLIAAEHPLAQEKALRAGYLPQSPEKRALYLFLTGQWEDYETLDFDQRLLQTAFTASPAPLRRRIIQTVQRSGRVAYLKILTGFDQDFRRGKITAQNAEVLFRILTANREWEQLWRLAPELPLDWSIRIPQVLVQNNWRPEPPGELEFFNHLLELTAKLSPDSIDHLSQKVQESLPPAVLCARLKVSGRANTVSFSPQRPLIAVGTGNRKVALWNFQHGEVETVYTGFNHAVGTSAFTSAGQLLVGEKTNQKSPCGVYLCENAHPVQIEEHIGSVTGLAVLDHANRILTAGRDQTLKLYDLTHQRVVSRQNHHAWGRSICVSPQNDLVALLHKNISFFQLPDLKHLPLYSAGEAARTTSMAQKAVFLPDGSNLIVGSYNGQVARYQLDRKSGKMVPSLLTGHSAVITGCEVLPAHNTLITASADGVLRFFQGEELSPLASIDSVTDRLASIEVSPGGEFLAVGSGDGSIQLWDLRVLELAGYLAEPLSTYPPDLLAALRALLDYANLPSAISPALEYIRLMLQRRFRFDIQIDQLATIRPGEFDIIID